MNHDSIRRLTLRAHLNRYTGYGEFVCQTFMEMSKQEIFVSVRPTEIDEQWGKASSIPVEMRSQIVSSRQPEPWELIICTPNTIPTPGRRTITFTMYESDVMPPEYISNLNRSELVIVPCEWNAENFSENGVKVPIEICPLGFDPKVFRPTPMNMHGPTVFGIAGRTRHCAKRKAIQESIDLFIKTFPNDTDVRLHVKIHPDDEAKATDHRVKISKAHFEPYELAQWINGLTCYLTLSRGEGFSLWPLQAMACGRPVIGAKYSGQADFLNETNAFVVPHREVDADAEHSNVRYLGQWAELNYKVAGQHMMMIHKSRSSARAIGEVAEKWVAPMTWENSANRLIQILEKVGAL